MEIDNTKINTRQGHCMVNEEYCFIFIPKCASIAMAWTMGERGWHHGNFKDDPTILDKTVGVLLRDPIARFISAYNYPGWVQTPGCVPHPSECLQLQDGHFAPQAWFLEGTRPDIYRDVTDIEDFAKVMGVQGHVLKKNIGLNDRFEQHRTPQLEKDIVSNYAEDYLLRSLWL